MDPTQTLNIVDSDVLIIGGGLAGCQAALRLREFGLKVALVEKQHVFYSGGASTGIKNMAVTIPGVHSIDKELERHLRATSGFLDVHFARLILEGSYEMMQRLERWGLRIRDLRGELLYDSAMAWDCNLYLWEGAKIKQVLGKACNRSGIRIYNRIMVTDLITHRGRVAGAVGFDTRKGRTYLFRSRAVLLTTGSCSRLYAPSTGENFNRWKNPYQTGDGYAAGLRVGAKFRNMEFIKGTLTPKKFSAPGINAFIAAGAKLFNANGERFMQRYAGERFEKAPRMILALAVYQEICEGRAPVYLDFRGLPEDKMEIVLLGMKNEKPTYRHYLNDLGIDLSRDRLEIELSEPYMGGTYSGGLVISHDFQAVGIHGLFAAGDASCSSHFAATGAMVMGWDSGEKISAFLKEVGMQKISEEILEQTLARLIEPMTRRSGVAPADVERKLQGIMSRYVGYARADEGLERALVEIRALKGETERSISAGDPRQLLRCHEVLNLLEIGEAVVLASQERKQSLMGLNFRRTDSADHVEQQGQRYITVQKLGGKWTLGSEPLLGAA